VTRFVSIFCLCLAGCSQTTSQDVWDTANETNIADTVDSSDDSCLTLDTGDWPKEKIAPPTVPDGPGISADELPSYETMRDALLNDPGVAFLATLDRTTGHYWVDHPKGRLIFERSDAGLSSSSLTALDGSPSAVFPSMDAAIYGDLTSLYQAYKNPNDVQLPDLGYTPSDPRIGFLDSKSTSYPLALFRISKLFDSPFAPDVMVGLKPAARGGVGSHGSLDLLPSRATLFFSGPGVQQGRILDEIAHLTDIAPTALALLGARGPSTKEGQLLAVQDGRVLSEALELNCQPAKHVVIVLLDGVMATEINAHLTDPNPAVDLPTFRQMAQTGVVYRYGALTSWPSFSAPGHLSVGTGTWSGTHGIINNRFFDRQKGEIIDFFSFIGDPASLVLNPGAFFEVYADTVHPEVETLAQAAHRHLGDWNPNTHSGAFVAVLNDFPVKGADRTSFDLVGSTPLMARMALDLAELADDFAVNQALDILTEPDLPVPTVLQLSFYTTDKAGEGMGPHSDTLRSTLADMDARMKELRSAYEKRGALKDTVFMVVSDHGMSLQDPNQTHQMSSLLNNAGLKVISPMTGMFYLRTIGVDIKLAGLEATIGVTNHDNDTPLTNVTIRCTACQPEEQTTDGTGQVVFNVPAGSVLEFEISHPDFNSRVVTVATPITQ
jgi:phosphonoacetate hydrolase